MNRQSTEDLSENTLEDIIMIGICLYFCPSPYNTKSEPQGKVWNLGDRMCQYMFIHGKKTKNYTMLVNDIDRESMHVWRQGIYVKSLFLPVLS